jgi:hypothetical protein
MIAPFKNTTYRVFTDDQKTTVIFQVLFEQFIKEYNI